MNKRPVTSHDPAFQAIIPEAGKADVHMHTTASDGAPTPRQLLEYVEHYTDLDVIAITDHDTMDGAFEAKKIYDKGNYRFDFILGEEVTSTAGHILALFIEKPIPKELSARETIALIHRQGGLAIAAHPLLRLKYIDPDMLTADGVGVDTLMSEQFDGVEVFNGSPITAKVNARAKLLNRSVMFRAETGSSDAHILEAIGKAYTLFPGKTADDFRRAIEQKISEGVSTRYRVSEILKYCKFYIKPKVREMGKRIFRTKQRKAA